MSKKHIIKYTLDPENLPPLTNEQNKQLEALREMPDSKIDLSDIPEVSEMYRPVKKQTTIRLDADVLAWLRSHGKGYQTRINTILRREMLASKATK